MFEINEAVKLSVKIYGKEYQLVKPRVKDYEGLQEKLDEAKTDLEKFRVTKSFVVGLGLPVDVADSLQIEHFTALVTELSGTKKN
jgi:hypothetical protein